MNDLRQGGELPATALFKALARAKLPIDDKPYAINIGCGDGKDMNDPVYPLYEMGFRGVAIDGYPHPDLMVNLGDFDVVLKASTFVYPSNIVQLLLDANCPVAPAFLKMDIDGCDGDVLKAILKSGIRPLVIQAEINAEIPPPYAFSILSSDAFQPGANNGFFGFSLQYGCDLLSRYGYKLIDLDFESNYTHDGLWAHESLVALGGLTVLDPTSAFLKKDPFLPHVGTVSQEAKVAWRTREDQEAVLGEIWDAMLAAGALKHGTTRAPFSLYISDQT